MLKFILVGLGALTSTAALAAKPIPLPDDSVYQLNTALTDQSGKSLQWAQLRGKPRVVSMFYTSCKYICPLIVDAGLGVDKQLNAQQRKRLGVVLVSMDPKRDTPAALMAVATQRKLDIARWTLLRPHADQVRHLAGVLGIRYRELTDGEFNHTSELVLLDRNGRIVARTEKVGSAQDAQFIAAVRRQASLP